ncbi:hypothetical protein A9404_10920 [Halothiobacillus diazotrophicus]|uniref:Uncharacterized protein n=1 Tax=Halothiobacillus diazotrophicus TaxID=1860122 RepID=A0A191ZIZ9_9GAMM|nr:hypothetical protein [Halothiobacillus diazotrophicus]ANJ67822.1 hypothetical protein A9404_10920 [Halothiobacillus diazotrophicus]
MQETRFNDTYPVYETEIARHETSATNTEEIMARLKRIIETDPTAAFIGLFDHYQHTAQLPGGEIGEGIRAAQNIVFCFGMKLPNPQVMAVRPRSIGVTEYDDRFVVNFMEPPMPAPALIMTEWVNALRDRLPFA